MLSNIKITRTQKSNFDQVDWENIPFGKVFSDHMFIADYRDGKWCDPRIVPYEPIAMSPAISALHYGQSIFEGMKAYRDPEGKPLLFRPEANHKRMNKSAERLCMPAISKEFFLGGLLALLKIDEAWIPNKEGYSLYIRPFMFAIDEYVGIRPSESYRFIIFTCPVGAYYNAPLNVKVSDNYVRAFPRGTGYAKVAGNYAAGMLPLKFARQEGFDQLVWLDGKEMKYVEESGTMNLFFQMGDHLVTPIAEGTILEGITRDSIIKIAKDLGIKVEVRKLSIEEVFEKYNKGQLKDAFGTGTAATIAPIQSITYKGFKMVLPEVTNRPLSTQLRKALDDIRTGLVADTNQWVIRL
ncbi:MAG: branched-chain amino acid aminotransferase [Bacteroidia bacterium]